MSSSKKIYLYRDFAAGVNYLRPRNPYPPLPHYIHVYSILIHTGKGEGGELNQREGKRGNSSQS